MKKNKWLTYLVLIAMAFAIFSQQLTLNAHDILIKTHDIRIKTLEYTTKEFFKCVTKSIETMLKLSIGQRRLASNLSRLILVVEDLQDVNKEGITIFDILIKIVDKIQDNQEKIQKYIRKHVDQKPAFLKIRLATIEVKVGRAGGAGTIIKIDNDYLYILTARHVVDCKGKIEIQATNSTSGRFVRIKDVSRDNVYRDKQIDMAIIKAPKPEGTFVALNIATNKPIIGTKIYSIGHPLSLAYTVNTGIVSNYEKRIFGNNKLDYMMISAPAFKGNSGGACVNCYNEVVGIVVGMAYTTEESLFSKNNIYLTHLVFVVGTDDINRFMKELKI